MKVLILGSGGREDTLAWMLSRSPRVEQVYCAPGNGGTGRYAQSVNRSLDDLDGLVQFSQKGAIDLVVVGPEAPLVAGICDQLRAVGVRVFGPSQTAAKLEGSKFFAKEFMQRHNIPTAAYKSFDDLQPALEYVKTCQIPIVVKADGLAAGKGVTVCKTREQAHQAVIAAMDERRFGSAGNRLVFEEFLEGEEASFMVISDGDRFVALASSQDHKPVFDNDEGPNTGGMGAYSPAPVVTPDMESQIISRIIEPTIAGMKQEGTPFQGVLYAGLMITSAGPSVVEYNVRFGDPETQVVLPRLQVDLLDVLVAAADGDLSQLAPLEWDPRPYVCVVMTSAGYPEDYERGFVISGLDACQDEQQGLLFHAGTKQDCDQFVTSGGRVLNVVGFGKDLAHAINNTYQTVKKISFPGAHYRRDIGKKAFKHLRT